ncbi:hypothetical protein GT755_27620 [Herbidospora sp. NEAU-GS84]|uniref:Uncharacterized protein n=1 Tax=Herbidospora solisilvae TaxID=2696284 RepID=A0A7C9JYN6_9ACTN|nr:hypothetical protein [Herbidospora solisilvae]NAS25439.1 hypothetical protein [Herbidospora solisilvae]
MISDNVNSAKTQPSPILNEIDEIPYAALRGQNEAFIEVPGTVSSGFQNFM